MGKYSIYNYYSAKSVQTLRHSGIHADANHIQSTAIPRYSFVERNFLYPFREELFAYDQDARQVHIDSSDKLETMIPTGIILTEQSLSLGKSSDVIFSKLEKFLFNNSLFVEPLYKGQILSIEIFSKREANRLPYSHYMLDTQEPFQVKKKRHNKRSKNLWFKNYAPFKIGPLSVKLEELLSEKQSVSSLFKSPRHPCHRSENLISIDPPLKRILTDFRRYRKFRFLEPLRQTELLLPKVTALKCHKPKLPVRSCKIFDFKKYNCFKFQLTSIATCEKSPFPSCKPFKIEADQQSSLISCIFELPDEDENFGIEKDLDEFLECQGIVVEPRLVKPLDLSVEPVSSFLLHFPCLEPFNIKIILQVDSTFYIHFTPLLVQLAKLNIECSRVGSSQCIPTCPFYHLSYSKEMPIIIIPLNILNENDFMEMAELFFKHRSLSKPILVFLLDSTPSVLPKSHCIFISKFLLLLPDMETPVYYACHDTLIFILHKIVTVIQ
jgi:hypothetical protein